MANRNKLLVPGARASLNQMKEEIAREQQVELGADTSARANGSVGGEMTKRLVAMAQQQMMKRQQ
ncbi:MULTISPECIES: alpha/beta-type small acid-soluble spore protein [unclassified Thermoactinomyces]|uniref:Alpha/beta-type small acid-soluble spore protein n=1 Tax=Thermoactinomyces daqus TaxID=1329516 RepID=A0A7W2AIL2_9BACL|nr:MULTISPECIES: alpha/beta-type small acid-soluble spore protein [unclassified Thermoactinomyces]MBA4542998.1 alpha/beta-type small acid-soluble spore protein [Thermoactinomyces daqus]